MPCGRAMHKVVIRMKETQRNHERTAGRLAGSRCDRAATISSCEAGLSPWLLRVEKAEMDGARAEHVSAAASSARRARWPDARPLSRTARPSR